MTTQLTPHFALEELLHSDTADAEGIDNTPDFEIVSRLTQLALAMERVRSQMGGLPIYVSSGYRCPKLNSAVGGASDSAHLYGCACDWTAPDFGSVDEICSFLQPRMNELWIDQLINESGGSARWVHLGLAVPPWHAPRNQYLVIG